MIMRRMNIRGLLVLLTLIPFYIPDLSAQTYLIEDRETLRGLKGFHVLVAELKDDIKQAGLTGSILKTDVELKFRKAGIRILTRDEALLTPGKPHLFVQVRAIKLKSPRGLFYLALVSFGQDAILSRNHSIQTSLVTWEDSFLGTTSEPLRSIREAVSDLVDEFMNDYLAVNPK